MLAPDVVAEAVSVESIFDDGCTKEGYILDIQSSHVTACWKRADVKDAKVQMMLDYLVLILDQDVKNATPLKPQ